MTTEESDIKLGLKRIAYLRRERTIILCTSVLALFGVFFLLQPGIEETAISQLIGLVVSVVGLAVIFNTFRFALIKCPKCHGSFNGHAYLLGVRRGDALRCTHCELSLSELPAFKPTYKSGGQEQW